MRAWRVARWMVLCTRGPWLQVAVPRLTALAFAVVQLDAMVGDWDPVTAQLARLGPKVAGGAAAVLVLLTGIGERRAARRLLLGDRHAVLRRQPLPGPVFGPGVSALLSPLAVPAASVGLLWHGSWWGALLWGCATLCPTVAFAADRPLLGVGATLPAAAAVLGSQAVPALLPWLGGAAVAVGLPAVGEVFARSEVMGLRPAATRRVGLRGPLTALVHRDLLALWRTERAQLVQPLATAPLAGLVVHAMRVNGPYGDEVMLAGAAVGVLVAALGALPPTAAVAARTGRAHDPAHWPTTAAHRVAATAVLLAASLLPTLAAVSFAAHLPVGAWLRLVGFAAAAVGGGCWWAAASPTRPRYGAWPWWLGSCLAATLVPAAWPALAALAVAAVARAVALTERRRRST